MASGIRPLTIVHKLPDDNGKVPKPNRVVGDSIPSREIVSLLDEKLAR